MPIDYLHDRIRKLKNPIVMDLGVKKDAIPDHLLSREGSMAAVYGCFCRELLAELRTVIPAVRFPFGAFALLGQEGVAQLQQLLAEAIQMGYYVLLDSPEILSPWGADRAAETIFDGEMFPCHGLLISPYIGSDGIKPFLPACADRQKDLFVVVRSPNRSAAELQDLRTGSRLVHGAAAELVDRFGREYVGKCAYSRVGAVVSAGTPESLRSLRAKYKSVFLLVDGVDYPSGSIKNCSYAFDRFGYGAAICAGPSLTAAWRDGEGDGRDFAAQAATAAQRMQKNLQRYVSIL